MGFHQTRSEVLIHGRYTVVAVFDLVHKLGVIEAVIGWHWVVYYHPTVLASPKSMPVWAMVQPFTVA
jgi:hypothetical protein